MIMDDIPAPDATFSRRQFLEGLAAVGAATTLSGFAGPQPPAPQESSFSINVFSKHLQFLDHEAMAETAAEIGFDGIDLTVREGGHVLPENVERDLPRAVEAVRAAGLEVPMMATDVNDPRDPLTEPVLETAGELGISNYRMAYLDYPDDQGVAEALEAYRPQLRRLAELNAQYGIHGDYQNHAGTNVGGPVWDLWMLLDGLDPRWLGCQYDIRHATVEGGESWPLGLRLLSPYIGTLVAKDFKWTQEDEEWDVENVPLGEGMVDFASYFEMLGELGIRGPMTLHFEYAMPEEDEALSEEEVRRETVRVMQRDLQWLRQMMAEAGLGE